MGLTSDIFIPTEITRHYELLHALGRPKKWETYLANERETGRQCVVRIFRDSPRTPKERRCLEESYLALSRVEHPALAKVLHLGIPRSGGHYLVHEYVEGVSLRSLAPHIGYRHVMTIIAKALPALHLLHLNGIVHQRLSPDKLIAAGMDESDPVRIIDTGISPNPDGRRWSPSAYSAPELTNNTRFDGRADLYSLAVTIYEVLLGKLPPKGKGLEPGTEGAVIPLISAERADVPLAAAILLTRMAEEQAICRPKNAWKVLHATRRTLGEINIHETSDLLTASWRWKLKAAGYTEGKTHEPEKEDEKGRARSRAKWLRSFCHSPVDNRRAQLLAAWMDRVYAGHATSAMQSIESRIKDDEGFQRIDWEAIQEDLAVYIDSKPSEASANDKEDRAETESLLTEHCFPELAGRILQKQAQHKDAEDENKARILSEAAECYHRAALTTMSSGCMEEAFSLSPQAQTLAGPAAWFGNTNNEEGSRNDEKTPKADHASSRTPRQSELTSLTKMCIQLVADAKRKQDKRNLDESKRQLEEATEIVGRMAESEDRDGTESGSTILISARNAVGRARISQAYHEGDTKEASLIATDLLKSDTWTSPTEKVAVMNLLATIQAADENLREAKRTSAVAGRLAVKLGDLHGVRYAMANLGVIAYKQGNLEAARRWTREVLQFMPREKVARSYGNLSGIEYRVGDYYEAARCALKGLRSAKSQRATATVADLQYNLGVSQMCLSKPLSSMKWLRRSISGKQSHKRHVALALLWEMEWQVASGNEADVKRCLSEFSSLAPRSNESQLWADMMCSMIRRPSTLAILRRGGGLAKRGLSAPRNMNRLRDCGAGGEGFIPEKTRRELHAASKLSIESTVLCNQILWRSVADAGELLDELPSMVNRLKRAGREIDARRVAAIGTARLIALGWNSRANEMLEFRRSLAPIRANNATLLTKNLGNFTLEELAKSAELRCKKLAQQSEVLEELLGDCAQSSGESCGLVSRLAQLKDREVQTAIELVLSNGAVQSVKILLGEDRSTFESERIRQSVRVTIVHKSQIPKPESRGASNLCWNGKSGHVRVAVWSTARPILVCVIIDPSASSRSIWNAQQVAAVLVSRMERVSGIADDKERANAAQARRRSTASCERARNVPGHKTEIICVSKALEASIQQVRSLASAGVPLLLTGESGTGKEVMARIAHQAGMRRDGPFVAVDCPSLTEGVGISELFGHAKGSFSGAVSSRRGLIREADGGVLFLDEIGDLSREMQARLLRVLSSMEVRQIGSNRPRPVRFTLVSATNKSLAEGIQQGVFRRDLFYRLGVEVSVPPLRDRREDIVPMWDAFLLEFTGFQLITADEAYDYLMRQKWRGNVRELKNLAQATSALCRGGRIGMSDITRVHQGGKEAGLDPHTTCETRTEVAARILERRGAMSRSAYCEEMGVSPRSALRDLQELVRTGVAKRVGKGRATRYLFVGTRGC